MIRHLIIIATFFLLINGEILNDLSENEVLRWCVISEPENKKCEDFAAAVKKSGQFEMNIGCVLRKDKHHCMQALFDDNADIVNLDAGELNVAGKYYSLAPILSEKYSLYARNKGAYSVAIVPSTTNITSLADLRNRKICFSGVGHMAGWIIPLAKLIEMNVLEVTDCNNLIKSASSFFGPSCTPNALNDIYNPSGDNDLKMCEICADWHKGIGYSCSGSDKFAGYEGAFRCMASGKGELAFLTHTTIKELIDSNSRYVQNNFRLLCPDGKLTTVDDFVNCNWGVAPLPAIVTSSSMPTKHKEKVQAMLLRAVNLFSDNKDTSSFDEIGTSNSWSTWSNNPTTRRPINKVDTKDLDITFKIFSSTKYDGYTSLLFQDTAVGFSVVPRINQTFASYLHNYQDVISKLRYCPTSRIIMCVTTEPALQKCNGMSSAFAAKDLKPDLICIKSMSNRGCMGLIKNHHADVAVFEAGDIYRAGLNFGLKPIIAEHYNLDENGYYAVAVAAAGDPKTDLLFLKGTTSCHTGIGTAAGWVLPIDFLTRNRWMRKYSCDSVRAASEFFSKSCAPGAMSNEFYGTSNRYLNLCGLCHGSSSNFCKRDVNEPFFSHTGAFRCLVEGGGQLAFMKHTTVSENVGGNNKQEWARNLILDDFELLCGDGRRASMRDFRTCNLGKVASNAIVAREKNPDAITDAYINLFSYAQQYYGHGNEAGTDLFSFPMFASSEEYPDLIFQDATEVLKVIPKDQQNYRDYLGENFLNAMRNTDCLSSASSISNSIFILFISLFFKFILS